MAKKQVASALKNKRSQEDKMILSRTAYLRLLQNESSSYLHFTKKQFIQYTYNEFTMAIIFHLVSPVFRSSILALTIPQASTSL